MAAQKPTKPATSSRTLHRQTLDDPGRACQVLDTGLDAVETKLGKLQKLITDSPPTVTGSKGGNAALASLIAVLEGLGLVKDGTT